MVEMSSLKKATCIHYLKPKFGIPLHVSGPMEETHLYTGHKISENQKNSKGLRRRKKDLRIHGGICTDDHIKELSLIQPIQYKGTLEVKPLSSASLYQMEFETSESDERTISTDTSERTSDSLFDTEMV